MKVPRRVLVWILVGLAVPLTAGAAEFLEFYKLGLTAIESQEWARAAEMMQEAIDRQPRAKARVKKALFFRRYLPHFYLGQAFFGSGNCRDALAAWRESESQGVVTRFSEFERLREGQAACQQMVDLQFALDEALGIVDAAETSAAVARRALSQLPSSDTALGLLARREAEAEAVLARARARLRSSDSSLSEVEQAAAAAAEAREEFEAVRRAAEQRQAALAIELREELIAQLDATVDVAEQTLAASEHLRPYPERVAGRRAGVQEALKRARAADETFSLAELQVLRSDLELSSDALQRAISPPPLQLTRAAEAYLTGDYARVLAILADHDYASARIAYQAHMLNAAALFSLFHSTGGEDQQLLDQARGEVMACRSADPSRRPPTTVFSPRFVAFFEDLVSEVETSEVDSGDEGL